MKMNNMKKIKKYFALVVISTILGFGFIIASMITHIWWLSIGMGFCLIIQFLFIRKYKKLLDKKINNLNIKI